MKEVNLHYFVPENIIELESLIGKPVGVKITSANSSSPMIYFGLIEGECEFLEQGRKRIENLRNESRPIRKIWGWRSKREHLDFDTDGVKLCSDCRRVVNYNLEHDNKDSRYELLKSEGLWEELTA